MNPFEMVVLIVVTVSIAGVLRTRFKQQDGKPRVDDEQARRQDARIAALEERVKALEAVVGDAQYELRRQFRDLGAQDLKSGTPPN